MNFDSPASKCTRKYIYYMHALALSDADTDRSSNTFTSSAKGLREPT